MKTKDKLFYRAAGAAFPKIGADAGDSTQRTEFRECGEMAIGHILTAQHGSDFSAPEGTQSCNTVPSNDNIDKFKPLRFGIDSLYLSYHGQLVEDWDIKLSELKEIAQSDDEAEQALAQVRIGAHIFEVRDKGMPRFPYVLVDNCFFYQAQPQAIQNVADGSHANFQRISVHR